MSKSNPGLLSVLAQAQRQRQRQQAAERRAWEAAQQKAFRAAHRAAAGQYKADLAAYQKAREAEAARQTADLEWRIGRLRGVLAEGAKITPFHLEQLKTTPPAVPFSPGPLGVPVARPDPARYQVPPLSAVRSISSAARREHEEQVAQARSRFEYDWQAAHAAEAERQRRLAAFHQQHLDWVRTEQQRTAAHNAQIDALARDLLAGDPEAIPQYFAAMLSTAGGWPAEFPRSVTTGWDPHERQLVVDWQLPGFDVIPEVARIRYVKSGDEFKPIAFPPGRRAALYRELLSQSCLRVVADVFRADRLDQVASVSFNGHARGPDSATGQIADHCLVTATIRGEDLDGLQLHLVDAVQCLTALRGQVSARPERLVPVRPGRRPQTTGRAATVDDSEVDLYELDPERFEELIADLFRARGLQVMTTARTGDEGVDVVAEDADPITGGLIVIQVKRYRATVSPSVVRDLYGVVQHRGATKGILVTTSGFGPGSHEFARGKPLTLIGGAELVDLLARAGLRGQLGVGSAAAGKWGERA